MQGVVYHRDLPHKFPNGTPIFVTWRLHGSLPAITPAESSGLDKLNTRERFTRIEKLLDAANSGPLWLKDPRAAAIVCETIERGHVEFRRYSLHAYVVMSNHVHLLITPRVAVSTIMNTIKGVTARHINQVLERTGKTFWQSESFDRWCRDAEHFEQARRYIEMNPVKVGVASVPGDYEWSSAHRKVCVGLGE